MKNIIKPLVLLFVLALPAVLSGCASMVVGAGASIGVAALEERPLKVHAHDTALATEIRYNLVETGENFVLGVGVEVYERKVLMTGVVKTEAMRAQALKLAWKVSGVKDV